MGEILYLTNVGLTRALGYSQVLRPVCALADRGYRYRILSLEPPEGLADTAQMAHIRETLDAHGVKWDALPYGPGRLTNARILLQHAMSLPRPSLVHARNYICASVALGLKRLRGLPYIFDTRGYWIDECLDGDMWFTSQPRLAFARQVEHTLYRNAAGVVMLTEVSATDVRHHVHGRWSGAPVRCIPTCVDYEDFPLRFDAPVDPEAQALSGKLVLGHLGALNQAYRIDEMLAIVRGVFERREDAHFLSLGRQTEEMQALVRQAGIDPARVTVRSVSHDRVAGWVRAMDWGFVLRETTYANRAAMPTKLGEFFASGVHPVAWGGNDDVRTWVRRAGTGVLLDDLDEASLAHAVETIATQEIEPDALARGRQQTRSHFSLAQGAVAYGALIDELLA